MEKGRRNEENVETGHWNAGNMGGNAWNRGRNAENRVGNALNLDGNAENVENEVRMRRIWVTMQEIGMYECVESEWECGE